MSKCSNCGGTLFKDDVCMQCGVGPRVGPAPDPEIDPDYICPQCGKEFNGWECVCGYAIPLKRRKMVGKRLTAEEAENLRKRLGIDQ